MVDVITALTTAISPTLIWGVVEQLVPWISLIFLVALGLYFLRRLVKGGSKGKVKF